MLNRSTTNSEDDQCYSIIIGDILLHSERKSIPVQVISQSLVKNSSQTTGTANIPRMMLTPSGLKNNQTRILCDLKNSTTIPLKTEGILSTEKFVRLHQVGLAFVKEIKSKIITISNKPSNDCTLDTDQQTHF